MQSVNNNPIKSITINKSQCSNKNRIFKIQTSCFSVMYKHRPGAEVHSASKSQLPVPHAASMEEKAPPLVSTVTVYCQGECTNLLLAFSCDFIDAVEFWFVFFLYICFICFI